MSRKEPLTPKQVKQITDDLIALGERYDMEFGVLFMQGDGPMEIFQCTKDPQWVPITQGIVRVVKRFWDEVIRQIASEN